MAKGKNSEGGDVPVHFKEDGELTPLGVLKVEVEKRLLDLDQDREKFIRFYRKLELITRNGYSNRGDEMQNEYTINIPDSYTKLSLPNLLTTLEDIEADVDRILEEEKPSISYNFRIKNFDEILEFLRHIEERFFSKRTLLNGIKRDDPEAQPGKHLNSPKPNIPPEWEDDEDDGDDWKRGA